MSNPFLTRDQVRKIDHLAITQFHIPGIVLMENAARALTNVARDMLGSSQGQVMILCGGGNNGGDGLAAARHLHNHRFDVIIGLCTSPDKYQGDALTNWNITQAMNLTTIDATPHWIANTKTALVIDAIFGTGLTQPPRPPFPDLLAALHDSKKRILAVDLPSGLDCDTGLPLDQQNGCIRAEKTVTFVAAKKGFSNPASKQFTGEVIVGDIGAPMELIELVSK